MINTNHWVRRARQCGKYSWIALTALGCGAGADANQTISDLGQPASEGTLKPRSIDARESLASTPSGEAAGQGSGSGKAGKEWTLAIYLASETLDDGAAIDNINALEKRYGEWSEFMDIIVLADGYFQNLEAGWDDRTRILQIRADDSPRIISEITPPENTEIARLLQAGQGELALSSPAVLKAFMDFAQGYYPSRYFALDVVDHGDGWRGAVFDYDQDMMRFGPMRNAEFHSVFASLARPIDVLGFDACLMQEFSANTWWQLGGPSVRYSVASEQPQSVIGWNMDGVARRLVERRRHDGQLEPAAFATEVVHALYDVQDTMNPTLSALDLGVWPDVLQKLDALGAVLMAEGGQNNPVIKSVVDERVTRNYGINVGEDAHFSEVDLVDAIDLCRVLEQAFDVATSVGKAAAALRGAFERAVVANATTMTNSHGVTLHLPRSGISEDYSQREFEKYAAEVVSLTPNWLAFLRSI